MCSNLLKTQRVKMSGIWQKNVFRQKWYELRDGKTENRDDNTHDTSARSITELEVVVDVPITVVHFLKFLNCVWSPPFFAISRVIIEIT